MSDLKPCPFCGSDDIAVITWGVIEEYEIMCKSCNVRTSDDFKTVEGAIKAWNTRYEKTCTWEHTDRCSWICSNCGVETEVLYRYWLHCPVCGAKVIDHA